MAERDRRDDLYAVPLEAFVAERTKLARELRKAGDRAAAAEVAKLPKPSPPAWALNHVARTQPAAMADWLGAADALRDASARPGDGGGLRSAMTEHRAATSRLMAVVKAEARPSGRPLTEAMLERVRALLQTATSNPGVADSLRAGRLAEEREPTGELELEMELAPEPPAPQANAKSKGKSKTKSKSKGKSKTESKSDSRSKPEPEPEPEPDREAKARAAEREREVLAATEELERLREEAKKRAAAASSAAARLDDARRTLTRVESEAAAADEAAREAAEAVARAERQLEQLRVQR